MRRMPAKMKLGWWGVSLTALALAVYFSIFGHGCGGDLNLTDTGSCVDSCPAPCNVDGDCRTSSGEKCCDFGEFGKACLAADQCPSFCGSDTDCRGAQGLGCFRTTIASAATICTNPDNALYSCQDDKGCKRDGEKCCTAFKDPVCVPGDQCPTICSKDLPCRSNETCCSTLTLMRMEVKPGESLCVAKEDCPTACSSDADCRNADGKLCCNGLCAATCDKACSSSNECPGALCCRTRALQSPLFGGSHGVPVGHESCTAASCGTGAKSYQTCCTGTSCRLSFGVGQSCSCASSTDCSACASKVAAYCNGTSSDDGGTSDTGSGCAALFHCTQACDSDSCKASCRTSASSSARTEYDALLSCVESTCQMGTTAPCANPNSSDCADCVADSQKSSGSCTSTYCGRCNSQYAACND